MVDGRGATQCSEPRPLGLVAYARSGTVDKLRSPSTHQQGKEGQQSSRGAQLEAQVIALQAAVEELTAELLSLKGTLVNEPGFCNSVCSRKRGKRNPDTSAKK